MTLSSQVALLGGADVRNCVLRKLYTILLVHGDADISRQGFTSDGYGTRGPEVYWLTLSDVNKVKKATREMSKLTSAAAAKEADWFEEQLAEKTKPPMLKTLACAIGQELSNWESRINVAEGKAAAARLAEKKRGTPGTSTKPNGPKDGKKTKKQKKAEKAAKDKAANDAATAALLAAGTESSPTPKLKRVKGGNPAGPPCRNFAKGTCKGPCRFSHAGGAPADDTSEDVDAEEDEDDDGP